MIGSTISHYKILEKLGEGGMGIVYKAHDDQLDRIVALKFLPHYLTSDVAEKERFYHEARAASSLNHPNITTIYEIAEHDNQLYIAMELVEGKTLKQLVQTDPPSIKKVLDIAIQACDGLSAAEEKKVVHRDIKSDNIMITPKGQVKIMDFGLAKVKGATKITKAGSTIGTAAYMSPEQAQGEDIDHRSDIFSFGVVLYELLTTKLPFRGEHQAALMYSLINEDPPPLARFNEKVTPDLERIVLKALAKDRDERYQHVDDMLADLRRERKGLEYARAGYMTSSGRIPVAAPPRKNIKKMIVIAGSVVVLVAAFLLFNPFNFQISTQKVSAGEQNSLAVLYFQNIVDPADKDHTGDMLTELLITSLSQSKGMEVISRERLLDIQKELNADSKSITSEMATKVAQRAGVTTMLFGSILQKEPQLAVTARIVDVKTGRIISSERVTGFTEKNIFALVDTLSLLVRQDLRIAAGSGEEVKSVADVTTSSPEAYRSYVEAGELNAKFYYVEATAAYKRAIELDPNFAMAYLGLATSNASQSDSVLRDAAQHAWNLKDNVTERERLAIQSAYASLVMHDQAKSLEYLETLIRKYPRTTRTYLVLALSYTQDGRYDDALRVTLQGLQIDSLDKSLWNQKAYTCAYIWKKEEAFAAIDRYLAISPAEPNPYDSKGDLCIMFGDPDSAIYWWKKALSFRSDFPTLQKLMFLSIVLSDSAAADRYNRQWAQTQGDQQEFNLALGNMLSTVHQGKLHRAYADMLQVKTPNDRFWQIWKNQVLMWMSLELGDFHAMFEYAKKDTALFAVDSTDRFYGRDELMIAAGAGGDRATSSKLLADITAAAEKTKQESPQINRRYELLLAYGTAILRFQEKNYQAVLDQYEQASRSMAPNHAPLYFHAVSLLKVGRLDEAVIEFRKMTRNPRISNSLYDVTDLSLISSWWVLAAVKAHYWLGVAYEQQGKKSEALGEYETFTNLWKNADFDSQELKEARTKVAALKGTASR